jgi:hypothetical protein
MTESRVADKPVETLVGGHVERADGALGRPRPATMDMRQRIQQVLAGQRFPAERWELIVTAEIYGADLVTRSELQALGPAQFQCLADVLLAVEHTRRVCRWLER